MAAGSPAQIADQVREKVLDVGIDGVIINLPNGHTPGVITAVAEALRPCSGCNAGRSAPSLVGDYTRSRLGVADCV